MSSPPPYDVNPDRRPLPAGWITQYDPNYKAWFYVNTEANPPVTTWNHPSGPVSTPSPEPRRYAAPQAPPVNNNFSTYPGSYNPAGGQGSYPSQNGYPQQPPFGDSRGAGYEQNYPQQNDRRGLGGLLGRLTEGRHSGRPSYGDEGRFGNGDGGFGRPSYGGGYPSQQQQPQVVYVEQQPQRKSGIGAGGLALGAGAGLLGGIFLGEALENNDCDRGDFGGGDFYDGGGDFGGDGGLF